MYVCTYVCVHCMYVRTYVHAYMRMPVMGDEIIKLLKCMFVLGLGGALATVCIDVHRSSKYCTYCIASISGWFALRPACH